MEQERYLAHIADTGETQTVTAHLTGVAALAGEFAAAFDARAQGEQAGLAHDIGKFSREFQRRLAGGPKVDHATAGAWECYRLGALWSAFCVAGHHGGLPDGGNQSQASPDGAALCDRMRRAGEGKLPDYSAWPGRLPAPSPPPGLGRDGLEDALFIRMLYSCLVDADYLDTEAFMQGDKTPPRGGCATLPALLERLEAHIAPWWTPKTELNRQRCAILRACLDGGESAERGLYTLTVPTGGGKTVASLAFALRHAVRRGLSRVIYVIPYTSIIEQNADVFRKILGAENVVEHHAASAFDLDENPTPEQQRQALATENWDAPVIVTTAVQFFESLYSNRSSRCRKLHNIANSVLIFDEAQTMPLAHLRPCAALIAQLVKNYRATAVLCTATQPALESVLAEFAPGLPIREIAPAEAVTESVFRRVRFRQAGKLSGEALAAALTEQRQALCVVNSRKAAAELYARLPGEDSFHLSTLMCPAHRRAVLDEIRRRLLPEVNEPCRVVSTSLIEAGVDVDFPALWRETAGLDAILQAAGRCNREGRGDPERSIVTIFDGEDPPPALFDRNIQAYNEALQVQAELQSPEAIRAYFLSLRSMSPGELDKSGIIKGFREGVAGSSLPFRTLAERFRLIDDATKTVYIPWGDGAALIERLRSGEHSRALYRALGQYAVSVYDRHYRNLYAAGALQSVDTDAAILTDPTLYSPQTGFSLKTDPAQALFG